MSYKHKSPSRLRRDQYRLSVYNCCKQILEIERKDEDIMVQQDQISLMNEAIFKYLDKIACLEKELSKFRKSQNGNYSLSCMRAVNIDIPPTVILEKTENQKRQPWPDWM